ncbi:MAG TPA: hypothetical protein VK445_05445 [Dissulfurispiraceae bacterium]|nr:hypothetical protein [Dissulfurispiraceae bacterium]
MKATRTIRRKDMLNIACPYFNEHYGGCLSTNMHGMTLASVVEHCGDRYTECTVYRKFSEQTAVSDYAVPLEGIMKGQGSAHTEWQGEWQTILCNISRRRSS